jgi:hypothetical protein
MNWGQWRNRTKTYGDSGGIGTGRKIFFWRQSQENPTEFTIKDFQQQIDMEATGMLWNVWEEWRQRETR